MITIEAIKEMMNSSTTLKEYEEVYQILKEHKAQINECLWSITEAIAEKISDIPPDIEEFKKYVQNISDSERQLLEEYASTQNQFRDVLNQVDSMMNQVHLKIRGFYDSNI